jgi:alpha-mannosidase
MKFIKHNIGFTVEKITARLALVESLVYRKKLALEPFKYRELPKPAALDFSDFDAQMASAEVIRPFTHWGQKKMDFVFQGFFEVPADWHSDGPVALHLPIGNAKDMHFPHPETLVYVDRTALTGSDLFHQEITLPARYCRGKKHELILHGWTRTINSPAGDCLYMQPCAAVLIDQKTRDFAATARTALDAARVIPEDSPAKWHLLNALDAAFKQLDIRQPFTDSFYTSVEAARATLVEGISRAGSPLDVEIIAVGHSHIDTAWLWPIAQTRLKCGRSFHTVLHLMEQFPQYRFSQSQPQLYEFIRQDYPELFEEIKKRVKQGRWEIFGGMWVEADCNISGPESLVRQFLLGRTFFAKHFGEAAESPILWLPDAFGYSYCLPQLMKLADIRYFFTTKITWNRYNRPPFESFWWKGLDGTRILSYFCTTPMSDGRWFTTYNGLCTPSEIYQTWTDFTQKESQQTLLTSFGYGDGGGGPTRQMLETIREMKNFPAMPKVRHGKAIDFFEQMEKGSADTLPVWDGELYLEYHRGTYTSQARTKRSNRKSEFKMHDAEFLASMASLVDSTYAYPREQLNKLWELICLNQFHDIIPGSSIGQVYEDAARDYEQIQAAASEVQAGALEVIAAGSKADLLIINPTAFSRDDFALWAGALEPGQVIQNDDGSIAVTQKTENGTLIAAGQLPPLSVLPLHMKSANSAPEPSSSLTASPRHLENDFVRVELNAAGDITKIYDKANKRDVLTKGAIANRFQAFEDRPINYDAWDVDIFFEDKMWTSLPAESVDVIETGPLRASLQIHRKILNSRYTQRISLRYNSPQLDFDTTIDWQERNILLKTAFPVNILSREATYEVQWGSIRRPVHRNTSWDWARFEVCAQKWADFSEGDYGVSLLNDCKYGHDTKDSVMRISLLRSPTKPDPEADLGTHQFAYSLLPHRGGAGSETIAAAYAFNDPLIVHQTKRGSQKTRQKYDLVAPLIQADKDDIVIETIKQAEDGKGIIVRFYEALCRRGKINLTANFEIADCCKTNLLERRLEPISFTKNNISLNVSPYEIVNLRIVPARA